MESDDDLRAQLREAERAAAAPWTDYPPTPRWYPPAVGLWATALTLAASLIHDHPLVAAIGLVALIAVEYAFVGWYRHYRGTMPSTTPPREFVPAIARFVLGAAAVAGVAWVVWHYLGAVAGLVTVFVLVTIFIAWYEREYAAAARAAKARLS